MQGLCRPPGTEPATMVLAMKGREPGQEIAHLPAGWRDIAIVLGIVGAVLIWGVVLGWW